MCKCTNFPNFRPEKKLVINWGKVGGYYACKSAILLVCIDVNSLLKRRCSFQGKMEEAHKIKQSNFQTKSCTPSVLLLNFHPFILKDQRRMLDSNFGG